MSQNTVVIENQCDPKHHVVFAIAVAMMSLSLLYNGFMLKFLNDLGNRGMSKGDQNFRKIVKIVSWIAVIVGAVSLSVYIAQSVGILKKKKKVLTLDKDGNIIDAKYQDC